VLRKTYLARHAKYLSSFSGRQGRMILRKRNSRQNKNTHSESEYRWRIGVGL
jgi:hypothetical protein